MKKILRHVGWMIVVVAIQACGQAKPVNVNPDVSATTLQIVDKVSSEVKATYKIEYAITQEEQERGLMYRQSLASDAGMLFVFPPNTSLAFWMKNTFIPLDIIYADENWEIVDIKPDNQPQSEVSIIAANPYNYCLEVNAGQAASHNIRIGDKLVLKK